MNLVSTSLDTVIFKLFLTQSGIVLPLQITTALLYAELRFLSSYYHKPAPISELKAAVSWLWPIFDRLYEAKRYREAANIIHSSMFLLDMAPS